MTAWSPARFCITSAGMATRIFTCTWPILNLVQRGDHADEKWRTLDSRNLHKLRLAVAPVADRVTETQAVPLGYVMVPRLDGNGAEVGGVSQQVMDLFSSRSRALTPELKQMIQPVHARSTGSRRASGPSGCLASRRRRTPGGRKPRLGAPSPGRPGRQSPAMHSGWLRGRRRRCAKKCRHCPRCTSKPSSSPAVQFPCWTSARKPAPRGSPSRKSRSITRPGRWHSSGSRFTAPCR